MGLLGSIGSIAGGAIGSFFGGSAGEKLGDTIGSGFGDLLQSGASSAFGYAMDMKQAKELMSMQYDMQRKLALNKYPWEVQSLESAGLNPILAATRGASAYSANAPVINAKRGQEAINSAVALGQIDNLRAQNELIRQQAGVQSATARQIAEQTKVVERENRFYNRYPEIYELARSHSAMPYWGPMAFGAHRVFSERSNPEFIRRKQRYPINMDGY